MKNILIASDHNGVELKKFVISKLKKKYDLIDLGTDNKKIKVDYTDYAQQLSSIISKNQVNYGILICGTGIGMSIVANKHKDVRAALVHNSLSANNSKEHNNSNIICLGSWINKNEQNLKLLVSWLNAKFGEGRHIKRIEKIETKKNTKKIVFTSGVFDILHTGHIKLLKFSKSLGAKLIVGINSDDSVRRIKGKSRPINNQKDRKEVLDELTSADEVIPFTENSPTSLMLRIKPHIYVKGSEFSISDIRRRDKVPNSVVIKTYAIKDSYSTSKTIQKIRRLKNANKKKERKS